jgi:hypothetical protein
LVGPSVFRADAVDTEGTVEAEIAVVPGETRMGEELGRAQTCDDDLPVALNSDVGSRAAEANVRDHRAV